MVVLLDPLSTTNVNSLFNVPVDGFLKNLSSAGKETSRSSSFIHLKVVSGSKKDKYRKVTPCPLLVMCKVVLDDT